MTINKLGIHATLHGASKDVNVSQSDFKDIHKHLKHQVLQKIKSGKLHIAIQTIEMALDSIQDKELKKTLFFICYHYNKLRQDVLRGLLNKDQEDIEERNIVDRILDTFLSL